MFLNQKKPENPYCQFFMCYSDVGPDLISEDESIKINQKGKFWLYGLKDF